MHLSKLGLADQKSNVLKNRHTHVPLKTYPRDYRFIFELSLYQ